MTNTSQPRRKPGRTPLNGISKLSKAEVQKRWREKQKIKRQGGSGLQQLKRQISINIDEETLARLDMCADNQLKRSRSETIRLLLNARMTQIDSLISVMQRVEGHFSKLSNTVFDGSFYELQEVHKAMIAGSCTVEDYKSWIKDQNAKMQEFADEQL